MDLGTVKSKLGRAMYETCEDFEEDVRLVFENAMKFNPKGHWVHDDAKLLLEFFDESFQAVCFYSSLLFLCR